MTRSGMRRIRLESGHHAGDWVGADCERRADQWLRELLRHPGADGKWRWDVEAVVELEDGRHLRLCLPVISGLHSPRLRDALASHLETQARDVAVSRTQARELWDAVGALTGQSPAAPGQKRGRADAKPERAFCSCQRRVPWKRAFCQGKVVEVLALHAPRLAPASFHGVCSFIAACYTRLDPVLPWDAWESPPDPEEARMDPEAWWEAVLAETPADLGGTFQIPDPNDQNDRPSDRRPGRLLVL